MINLYAKADNSMSSMDDTCSGKVKEKRIWKNLRTAMNLLACFPLWKPSEYIIYIFSHILHYKFTINLFNGSSKF